MLSCSNCKHFKHESASGEGWCQSRNKLVMCDDTCQSHAKRYTSFSQRCMELPYGFDNPLCDGKTCPHRRKCVRYMLHIKKRLTATPGAVFYMVCNPANKELCFWNYYENQ